MTRSHRRRLSIRSLVLTACIGFAILFSQAGYAQNDPTIGSRNKPERIEWFEDQGFGLFVHWSVDSQLGVVISHSLVGASPDYTNRFFKELPKTFNPTRFDPAQWARLARLAGVRYVMFTTKHHSGFTMFHTTTTPFSIANTPFHRDITADVVQAFRAQGIAPGIYFSPDDFWWLHQHNKPIKRLVPDVQPGVNPGLLAYDKQQLTELLTHYGPIKLAYFDGEAKDLRDLAWTLQPDIVVTRGAMETPELSVPGAPLPGPWEASITMGTSWQFQPDNQVYQSGHDLIRLLFQTRAKGGNLLLNIGPEPDGQLAPEQEDRLREIGLWMFVNSEAIYAVRPWIITNESIHTTSPDHAERNDRVWFTKKKDNSALYAILDLQHVWQIGTWQDVTLHSVRATPATTISVLGQDDQTVEYKPALLPQSTFVQQADGLHIHVMRAQRLQDDRQWPNATVVKLTHVVPALVPPRVFTETSTLAPDGSATFVGNLLDMGDAKNLIVGFEYRSIAGEDTHARSSAWTATPTTTLNAKGQYSIVTRNLPPGPVEFHAIVKHPLLTLYGADKVLRPNQ